MSMSSDCSGPNLAAPSTPAPVGTSAHPVVSPGPSSDAWLDATYVAALAGVDLPGLTVVEEAFNPPTVTYAPCRCGVLLGEECDCREFAADAADVFKRPLFLDLRAVRAAS